MKLAFKREPLSEKELIEGCIAEDRQVQSQLFNRYAPKMLGVCYRYAQNREEARDVMQDGFVKVFNNLKKFRQEASLETWITRIMVNTALNHLKSVQKLRMETDLEVIYNHEQVSTVQFHQIDTQVLMGCIQELPAGYRVVLNMYAIEGYAHKEIADALGISESTSRSQFARAKALLEKKLRSLGLSNDIRYAGD